MSKGNRTDTVRAYLRERVAAEKKVVVSVTELEDLLQVSRPDAKSILGNLVSSGEIESTGNAKYRVKKVKALLSPIYTKIFRAMYTLKTFVKADIVYHTSCTEWHLRRALKIVGDDLERTLAGDDAPKGTFRYRVRDPHQFRIKHRGN